MKPSTSSSSVNSSIYFKLTRIVALTDIVISLTDTVVTALIFFGDEQDTFKSLYYKIVKQKGIIVFHSSDQVRWNQTLISWVVLVVITMFNLLWFNTSCYLLYSTTKKSDGGSHRLNYCRSWLLVSAVLLIIYSIHTFTNGNEYPISLIASLAALVYRVFVVCVVYGLLLLLEENARRPFFSTVNGIYLHPPSFSPSSQKHQQQRQPHQDTMKPFNPIPVKNVVQPRQQQLSSSSYDNYSQYSQQPQLLRNQQYQPYQPQQLQQQKYQSYGFQHL